MVLKLFSFFFSSKICRLSLIQYSNSAENHNPTQARKQLALDKQLEMFSTQLHILTVHKLCATVYIFYDSILRPLHPVSSSVEVRFVITIITNIRVFGFLNFLTNIALHVIRSQLLWYEETTMRRLNLVQMATD